MPNNKTHSQQKTKLHPRSKHRDRYDFGQLIKSHAELSSFVKVNDYGDESIDFFNPKAVTALNTALLKHFYNIGFWEIPKGYLCPPIPGRADYIHYMADLLASKNKGVIPKGNKIKCLDIGAGANCVYPIIGHQEYGWSFIGSDIDAVSIGSAQKIVELNPTLKDAIELRLQANSNSILKGVIKKDERIDIVICNPPFHASLAEAQAGSIRKLKNLKKTNIKKPTLNFGGQSNELWCDGGELEFVKKMIHESKEFAHQISWFSSLISKEAHLKSVYRELKKVSARDVKTIDMGQGNKVSRVVVWEF
ncbi:MAG: 23S rRNA (adenine(1618)-N(6))-methyltransferase RlmF [Bacteroidales bacterium]|nr:23S rRNA (adenine(1618)-N(6))-methyltransferase RlmF [Bacteroidales bacterium]